MQFNGKTALVTGANRGIGLSIAEALLDAGIAKLYAAVRKPESAQPLIDKHGERVVAVELDLAKPDTITEAAKTASDIDIVVNNGGVLKSGDPLSPDALDNAATEFDVNVNGLIRMAQAFAPTLKNQGKTGNGAAFVQLNSVASLRNFAPFTTYAASKAAAYSYTQGLRDVLAEHGVTVVSVHPGPIATDMGRDAGFEDQADPPTVVADAIVEALKHETFHVFPDTMAKQFWEAYQGFAQNVVESQMAEA